jgi:hypothetical protein
MGGNTKTLYKVFFSQNLCNLVFKLSWGLQQVVIHTYSRWPKWTITCHQKKGERVKERAMHQHRGNRTWRAPRPRSNPSSPILDLHHNPHPNNLQNSSAYNTWLFNKNGQLKIKINTSEHREQISVLRIRLTKQGLSHVRSTMHTILIATGASSDACEVRSFSVPLSSMSL